MYDTLFSGGTLVGEGGLIEGGYLAVKDGAIAYVGNAPPREPARRIVEMPGLFLSPGFIDTHCHGGGGSDFMDGTEAAWIAAAQAHLWHGTTTLYPTSMASGDEDLFAFLDGFERARESAACLPNLPGVHLEGPYFSPAQAGAQPPEYMRRADPDHYLRVLAYGKGNIARWSCAPEVPGVLALGEVLAQKGILGAIAHTDADLALVKQAVAHGFTHLTHFYSGMSMLKRVDGHRILGAVEAGYLLDSLTVEIIADGVHLPPELLELIVKCKPLCKISLVTDSMRAAGMPEGPSILGSLKNGLPVTVRNGVAMMEDGQGFAGSIATADRLVRVMVKQANVPLEDAVAMMTQNPARLMGIENRKGSLIPGKDADLVMFDGDIRMRQVYIAGKKIDGEELS